MKWTLRKKLTLSVLGVIALFGSVAVYFVFNYSEQIFSSKESDFLMTSVEDKSHEASLVFGFLESLSSKVASNPEIISYLSNENDALQKNNILNILKSYSFDDSYLSVYLLDKTGLAKVSTDETFTGNYYSFRDYYKESIRGSFYVDFSVGVTSKELGYYFSSPVKDESGNVLGVVVFKMSDNVVDQIFKDLGDVYNGVNLFVADSYGVIVYSNNPDFLFKTIAKLDSADYREIIDKRRYSDISIEPLVYAINKSEFTAIQGNSVFNLYDTLNSESRVVFVSKVSDLPFYIVADRSARVSTNTALDISLVVAFCAIFAAILCLFLIRFAINKFIRPMRQIIDVFDAFSRGDLSQRILIDSDDEVGDLVKKFNKMADILEKRLGDVEADIYKRTVQLEKLNKSLVGRELKMIDLKGELANLKDNKKEE